jgi:hypothetical protein
MVTLPSGVLSRAAGGGGAVSGFGHNLGFAGVVLGVEHFVFDAVGGVEQLGEFLGVFDAGGADQDGLAGGQIAHRLVVGLHDEGHHLLVAVLRVVELANGFVDAGRVFAQPLLDRLERGQRVDQQEGIVGSPLAAHLVDLLDDCLIFLLRAAVNLVVVVEAVDRAVGGDFQTVQPVDLHELVGFGHGRTGHARPLVIELEEVLDGDRGHRLGFFLDGHVLLGFHRLVQPVGPLPAHHQTTGELVHNDDLAVLHDVVLVAHVNHVGAERLLDDVRAIHVRPDVEAADLGFVLGGLHAVVGDADLFAVKLDDVELAVADGFGFFFGDQVGVDLEAFVGVLEALILGVFRRRAVAPFADAGGGRGIELLLLADQHAGEVVAPAVLVHVVVGRPGDDQRGARLVDEDRVHFVDHAVIEWALHLRVAAHLHVVAEVVESEFAVGAVGDVAGVFGAAQAFEAARVHLGLDVAHGDVEQVEDRLGKFRIAFHQVIVDRHDVDALALADLEIGGEVADDGLALAGAHFRDLVLEEGPPADELAFEVAVILGPLRRLAEHGERFRHDGFHAFAIGQSLLELRRLGAQRCFRKGADRGFKSLDLVGEEAELFDQTFVARSEDLLERVADDFLHAHGVSRNIPARWPVMS